MILTITIDGQDRTSLINWKTIKKSNILTSQVDSFSFSTKKYGARSWTPQIYDEIIVEDENDVIFFAGVIISVSQSLESGFIIYNVNCKDYTALMDQKLVAKVYEDYTVKEIIDDLVANFIPAGFDADNVLCDTKIDYIAYNYVAPSKVLADLAGLASFDWYVDYEKSIHFFAKGVESAPFEITDTNAKAIKDSLSLDLDNSQLRNVVYVRGGEYKANSRTESYVADGEQISFTLINKFSDLPAITKDGNPLLVGVDNLNNFDTFDVLWNYNEKSIRFDDGDAPAEGEVIAITGTPLIPVLVKVEDYASVVEFGEKEFIIKDKTILSKETARARATAELTAYAQGITDGSFDTYETTLRAGQTIRINSAVLGVDEYYIISRVNFRLDTQEHGKFNITLTSAKTLGIIEFLQNLLTDTNKNITINKNEVLDIVKNISEIVSIAEEVSAESDKVVEETIAVVEVIRHNPWTVQFCVAPYIPLNDSDPKRVMRAGISSFVY